jgi:hypothetical protein
MATNQQQQKKKEQEKNSSVLFQKIDLLSPSKKEDISTTEAKSNMSSTKNTKGNRQVVVATYTIQSIFEIPNGLDLEDKSVVENWGVKWNELIIQFVNGEEKEIDPTLDAREGDFKRPEDYEIVPAKDAGYKYDEEEEEEEKYECADCKKKYDNGELFVWDIENGNEENAEELMEDCELRTDYKRCEGCYYNFSGKVIEFLEKKEKNMEEEEEEEEEKEVASFCEAQRLQVLAEEFIQINGRLIKRDKIKPKNKCKVCEKPPINCSCYNGSDSEEEEEEEEEEECEKCGIKSVIIENSICLMCRLLF